MDFDTENGFSNLFGKEETERYPMIFSYTLNWRDKANRFSLEHFFVFVFPLSKSEQSIP